ncbi:MAG: hypothetical protein ACRD34_08435 [Bryobacteraceae bacterium]
MPPDDGNSYEPTLLRVLITERHWQKFTTFERQFRLAAARLAEQQSEPDLRKVTVSPRQFERWYAGKVKTEPYPDACRVLEYMFGIPVRKLLDPVNSITAGEPGSAPLPQVIGLPSSNPGKQVERPIDIDSDSGVISLTENARLAMNNILSGSYRPDIEYLMEGVRQHAVDSVQTPPQQMLRRLVEDHNEVRMLISERQPLRQQKDLYHLLAQISSLIADELMVLGKPLYAESWHEMARRAADETEDNTLRAQARTLAAMLPVYYGDPTATVHLAREAQAILSDNPHAAKALAPTLESLACVQLGDHESARLALESARRSFDELDAQQRVESVFAFSVRRWHFYESRILSLLGDIKSAIEAQDNALALYPREVVGDRALIQLDKASCIVRSNEIADGLQMASEILVCMAPEYRADIFIRYAWNVAAAVPARFRSGPEVAEYRELLRSLPTV